MEQSLLDAAHRWNAKNPGAVDQNNLGERTQKMILDSPEGSREVWAKFVTADKRTIWHRCQRLVSGVTRMPIMRPTVSPGGSAAHLAEVTRLRKIRTAGFNVPEVLAVDDCVMVLSDMGPTMRTLLKAYQKSPTPEKDFAEIQRMLFSATEMLCEFHAAGFIHGRPHVKDFTWKDGQVGFLDLEEDPTQVMSWHEARARDVWMFLVAVAGHLSQPKQRDELLAKMLEEFLRQIDFDSRTALNKLVRAFKPVRQAVDLLLVRPLALVGKTPSRDVRQALHASLVLEKLCLAETATKKVVANVTA